MKKNFKPTFKTKIRHHSRRDFFVFSLIFVLMFSALSAGILTAAAVPVSTETELRNAINNAVGPTVIELTADIHLTGAPLTINADKDITLTSSGTNNFRLVGVPGTFTITVNDGATLDLAGITVTHTNGATGRGVGVSLGGTLILSGGEISGNTYTNYGAGVNNYGTFIMISGEISDNTATISDGGVYNSGNFTMFGGEISGNKAERSGGVGNVGNFTLAGGKISGNAVTNLGGGIENLFGIFTMTSGEISNNTAGNIGGGIFNYVTYPFAGLYSNITISGGTIFNNTANEGGGIYNEGSLVVIGGVISNNMANSLGGGVYNSGDFSLSGGKISNNIAIDGGGVANSISGTFTLTSGEISTNTAYWGGGVDNFGSFTMSGGTIFNNTANEGGGIYLDTLFDDGFTMIGGTISNNMAINGGGMYIDQGVVELFSGTISGNIASNDGGGIWVAYANLNKLFVYDGMVFANNRASVAYNRNPLDDALYHAQIGPNVVWTVPFTQGYNNYDISYKNGTRFALYNVTVIDSYAQITGAGSYQEGGAVTINAGTRSGYTFAGWTVNQGGIILPNTPTVTFTMPPNNVEVTANWRAAPPEGSFSVTKLTNPSSSSTVFNFVTSAPPGSFSLTDGMTWNSGPLASGNYTLTEIAQTGWDLTNIIINDPTNNSYIDLAARTVFINLSAGETISILYQNTQQTAQTGSVTVLKSTCPTDAPNSFNFVTSIPPGTFSLTNGEIWNSGPIAPGNYTLTEIAQTGWDLTNIIINDPDGGSRVDLATRTVFIDLDPGETITILYQNTEQAPQPGSISVSKVTCPVGSPEVFRFVTSASPGGFSLTDGMTWNSGPLAPGIYTITELAPAGWTITNIIVNDPTGHYSVDLSAGTVTIDLQPGSRVSIVYQDAEAAPQPGYISVVKTTCPTNTAARFTFVSSALEGSFSLTNGEVWTSGPLTPGRYIVTEIMQPCWTITGIIVVDPSGASTADLATGTATINLQAGSQVTIIYQNTEQTKPDCCCCKPCDCKDDCKDHKHPDCSPTPPPCSPTPPPCSPTPPPCTQKPDCRPPQDCCTKHPNTKTLNDPSVDSQTETNDDAPVSTPSPSDENKSTNNNSSSSTSSTSTSSSKAASNVASSDSVAVDAPLSSPAAVLPDAKDPQPSATQSTSEGSVMFGLGWLGATLVVLFGAIVTVLAITAIHLTHKKTAKL